MSIITSSFVCDIKNNLTSLFPRDGNLVTLQGYTSVGDDGGQILIYHQAGRSGITVDDGFFFAGGLADDYFEAFDKQYVHLKRFGCIGDGVTDDLARINQCISTAQAFGVPILVDKGTYKVSNSIQINDSICITTSSQLNTRIGVINDTAIIKDAGVSPVFSINAPADNNMAIQINGIGIRGGTTGIYIYSDVSGDIRGRESNFSNLNIRDCTEAGIFVDGPMTIGCVYENIYIQDIGNYGMRFLQKEGGVNGAHIRNCRMISADIAALSIETTAAPGGGASAATSVDNCIFEDNSGNGVNLYSCEATFKNCWFELNGDVDFILTSNYNGSSVSITNATLINCVFGTSGAGTTRIRAVNHGFRLNVLGGRFLNSDVIDLNNRFSSSTTLMGAIYGTVSVINAPSNSFNDLRSSSATTFEKLVTFKNNVTFTSGLWDGAHLIMGTHHIWVDSTGDLRIKNGAPTSDLDGTIIGLQS